MHDRVAIELKPETAALLERQVLGSSTLSNDEERTQGAARRRKQSAAQYAVEQNTARKPPPAPVRKRAAMGKSASPNAGPAKATKTSTSAAAGTPMRENDRVHDAVTQLARLLARQAVAEFQPRRPRQRQPTTNGETTSSRG